jgi:hypothetical protein
VIDQRQPRCCGLGTVGAVAKQSGRSIRSNSARPGTGSTRRPAPGVRRLLQPSSERRLYGSAAQECDRCKRDRLFGARFGRKQIGKEIRIARMLTYLRHIDWKLLLLGFLGCYVLPSILVGTLFMAASNLPGAYAKWIGLAVIVCALLGPPLAAGYCAARFAKSLPQLHTLLLGLLGLSAVWVTTRANPILTFALVAIVSLGCNSLGAFVWMRRDQKRQPSG